MASHEGAGAGSILMAFVLGAISGAAVALLWAPAPGTDTRRVLGDRAREGADRAAGAARDFGDRVREGAAKAAEAVQQGREFVSRQRESVAAAVERGREAYQQAREQEKA
jgi:gas vesicle protein